MSLYVSPFEKAVFGLGLFLETIRDLDRVEMRQVASAVRDLAWGAMEQAELPDCYVDEVAAVKGKALAAMADWLEEEAK